MKTAVEFFEEKYGNSHDQLYDSLLMIQFATDYVFEVMSEQNTLNRDKVDAILYDCFRFSDHYGESAKEALDAICSLSLPTLSEINEAWLKFSNHKYGDILTMEYFNFIDAVNHLTKPKEEER